MARESLIIVFLAGLGGCGNKAEEVPAPGLTSRQVEAFPRCAAHDPLNQPFFGDTHVHTTLSLDANLQGTRLQPDDAYRFARGEQIGIQPYDAAGNALRHLQLDRPLDFAMVSDHAEFLGTVRLCSTPGSTAYDDPDCQAFRDRPDFAFLTINALTAAAQGIAAYPELCGADDGLCLEAGSEVWAEIIEAAEAAYDRTEACTFTTFVGYEWSGGPDTYNLHRNVVFRHDQVPERPTGYFDAPWEKALWDDLSAQCLDAPPCDVLTIPHNSNISNGLMFEDLETAGADPEAAATRAAMEPLVEIMQHKGDSECWPGSSLSDELCGFEKLPYNSLSGSNLDLRADPVPLDFVRDVLAEGLRFQQAVGVNPYQYGIVASTDTHLAAPGAAGESGFPGHGGAGESHREELPEGLPDNAFFNPGGLAVLWAEENSREALFRAMRRREAYGTSGPRIVLRFFGGWDYDDALCDDPAFAEKGYGGGVPMGGELPAPAGAAPVFAVAATADPGTASQPGAPLQRLQIVKGWLDGDEPRVTVHDVDGGPSDAGVDTDTCERTGAEGARERCAVWRDPDFDPSQPAFYYARVIEDPSCRWTQRLCNEAGITCPTTDEPWAMCCDPDIPATVQERAWSSPVWWTPG